MVASRTDPDTTLTDDLFIRAIGIVLSPRQQPLDDDWDSVVCTVDLAPSFGPESVRGLADFSHLEVVYLFHAVDPEAVCRGARHPRGNLAWPEVGIFAQRAKDRPNRIGISICELLSVDDTRLRIRGLDAIDGSPVLDVKPYFAQFAPRTPVHQPAWSTELMRSYWSKES
jgi:tRNA-Thr(GGU) m(6)t(6)A37 methyltransferase TsaA